jgi:hypothetical protein
MRLQQHLEDFVSEKSLKAQWLKTLKEEGNQPQLVVLEEIQPGDDWEERERTWIAYLRELGEPLTNTTDGGKGLSNPPAAVREACGVAGTKHAGRPLPTAVKEKIAATQRYNYAAGRSQGA